MWGQCQHWWSLMLAWCHWSNLEDVNKIDRYQPTTKHKQNMNNVHNSWVRHTFHIILLPRTAHSTLVARHLAWNVWEPWVPSWCSHQQTRTHAVDLLGMTGSPPCCHPSAKLRANPQIRYRSPGQRMSLWQLDSCTWRRCRHLMWWKTRRWYLPACPQIMKSYSWHLRTVCG